MLHLAAIQLPLSIKGGTETAFLCGQHVHSSVQLLVSLRGYKANVLARTNR